MEEFLMKRMLKVTSLMSSTTIINLLLNTIKIKFIAIFIGPAGMGIFSLLRSIYNVFLSLGSIVTGGSVVKSIVELRTAGDIEGLKLLQHLLVLTSIILGSLSGLIVYCSSNFIALKIFNDISYSSNVRLMSFLLVFINLSLFWQSWLNGFREIKKIAKTRLLSNITITLVTVCIIYFLKHDGIIYAILILPLPAFFIARYLSKPLDKPKTLLLRKSYNLISKILKLGFSLVLISLVFQGGIFLARSIITDYAGLVGTGIVFAAWSISMSYVEIFLNALGVDYYPELVECKDNNVKSNSLINSRLNFLLLIMFPLLLLLFIFSPVLITVIYSSDFNQASSILKYQLIGDVFKVITWIFGYVLIVQGYILFALFQQVIWTATYILIIKLGFVYFNLEITGIAFILSYLISSTMSYIFLLKKIGFTFSTENKILLLKILPVSIIFILFHHLNLENLYILALESIIAFILIYLGFIKIRNSISSTKHEKKL
jgi:PST family polysaccharide transporter